MEKKYNYTYQIKNLLNNKTYIGVHSTDDLNDGYMGSGVRLQQSMNKHGEENFVKTIMCFFDTADEAYEEEEFLVDEEWVKRKDNYNLREGGSGGRVSEKTKRKISDSHLGMKKEWTSKNNKEYKIGNKNFLGRTHTEETKNKMSESRKYQNMGNDNPKVKNKKSNLPHNVCNYRSKKNPFYVRVRRKVVGYYSTIEEAVEARDNYLEKLQQSS
jgi:hypothetical protein